MAVADATFEEHFARELLASEQLRVRILVACLLALLGLFGLMYLYFQEYYRMQFGSLTALAEVAGILGLLLLYEVAILRVIDRERRAGAIPAPALRYLNSFVEGSIPTVLIIAVAGETNPVYVLQSAATFLYAVFIVLSTLRLDPRLSSFTGAVAAGEYLALNLYYQGRGGEALAGMPFELPPFFIAKAGILLIAGFAAGFVAHQLKRRVGNAWRALQERRRVLDAFGQQVSPAIVEALLRTGAPLESRRMAVCVLFLDVRSFTPLVEGMTPEEIVQFQNAVFGAAVEVIDRHHGVINQFLGDGFMATFGAPVPSGRDCANALAAARDLVACVRRLGEEGRIPRISIGIGLHAGDAVTGNIGSADRQQYSITGNVVILASRIEQLNKEFGSQILASAEVLAAAGVDPGSTTALGPVRVKGREQPIELFRLA